MPSDTPLTDAALDAQNVSDDCPEQLVPAEFARELERKIARLEREIADMGRGD